MGVKIFRSTDRISVKIGELEFKLAPLTFRQKAYVTSATKLESGVEKIDGMEITRRAMKCMVKEVNGVEYLDGTNFKVDLDEKGELTDSCVEELFMVEASDKLMLAISNLLSGPKKNITDPDGKPIDGVLISYPGDEIKKNTPLPQDLSGNISTL